jgi:hypothetical protein
MEKAELLDQLNGLVDKYEQHRKYIDKAKSQSSKFSAAVVEKVILDHEIKSESVADQVQPLIPQLDDLVAALEAEKAGVESKKNNVDEQLQELELRHDIGELEDAEYAAATEGLKTEVGGANSKIAGIDADLDLLGSARRRWVSVAEPAGHYKAPAPPPDGEVIHAARTEIKEDVSLVFAQAESHAAQVRIGGEEEIAIETAEVAEEASDGPSADVQFGFEPEPAVVEIVPAEAPVSEIEIELSADAGAKKAEEPAARRALLLYQEGTAEEQIYPFTGEQLTIGRGRENYIQIKNDSKVSRYHCKLFRRGNNFYIEDIKSSNGTLVNGELITDRRLFGGEEIIIGETFFRFRIME